MQWWRQSDVRLKEVRWRSGLSVAAKMEENGRPPMVVSGGGSSEGVMRGGRGGAWSGDRRTGVMGSARGRWYGEQERREKERRRKKRSNRRADLGKVKWANGYMEMGLDFFILIGL